MGQESSGIRRNGTGIEQYFTLPGLFHVESMEWGVESMEWWMDSMGMDSILLVDGFHGMGDGFHTFSRWIPYLFQMDSLLFSDGFHTFSIWNPGGISSWNDKSTLMP